MQRHELERLLPEVFLATLGPRSPLGALLDVMAQQHQPSEHVLDHLESYFDPHRTDDRFVPLLSRWVDLDRLFNASTQAATRFNPATVGSAQEPEEPISTGTGRLRELVARAAELSQWRGTRTGLLAFLETATGQTGFQIDEHVTGPDGPRPFHILIRAPASAQPHQALIERIIELEKPAYVTCDLEFSV